MTSDKVVTTEVVHIDAPKVVRSDVDGGRYPLEKFQQAYKLFMMDDKPVDDIASEVGLPRIVILDYSMKNKWAERKANILQEQVRMLEIDARLKQALGKGRVIDNHLDTARKIAKKAAEEADNARNPRDLKSAADAFKAAADVEARAVGLAEKTIDRSTDKDAGTSKTPSFFIGVGATRVTIGTEAPVEQPKDITGEVVVEQQEREQG